MSSLLTCLLLLVMVRKCLSEVIFFASSDQCHFSLLLVVDSDKARVLWEWVSIKEWMIKEMMIALCLNDEKSSNTCTMSNMRSSFLNWNLNLIISWLAIWYCTKTAVYIYTTKCFPFQNQHKEMQIVTENKAKSK